MINIVGLLFGLGCMFGGYILHGGNMEPILHAAPWEIFMIGGAAMGSLLTANSMPVVKGTFAGLGKIMSGPYFKKQDYMDTIFLVSKIMKVLKAEGAVALEIGRAHV